MTDKDFTYIGVVLDRSGSMARLRDEMQGGFDTFIEEQRKVEGRAVVSLHQFDNDYETVYFAKDIRDVPKLELIPRGMTALLDATGRAIVQTGEYLKGMPEDQRPGNVTFIVITDGIENASVEYTRERLAAMIKEQQDKYAWHFIFLGANQDAITTGAKYGYSANTSLTYGTDAASVYNTYSNLSASVTRGRSATRKGFSSAAVMDSYTFTPDERTTSNVGSGPSTSITEATSAYPRRRPRPPKSGNTPSGSESGTTE
jgi:hypothetical protein